MANTPMVRSNMMDGTLVSLPLLYNAGGTEVDTGFVLPTNSIIYPWEMWVIVDTIDATETVDIGILSTQTGGDANGFISLLSVATAGVISPVLTQTQGTQANYYSASTFGVLFFPAAGMGANVTGQNGLSRWVPYICDGVAKNISYTPSTSDTFVGRLVFRLWQLPT